MQLLTHVLDVDGLVQERRNSSALAMELRLSYTNPSISAWYLQALMYPWIVCWPPLVVDGIVPAESW